jgi:hypothetical protein
MGKALLLGILMTCFVIGLPTIMPADVNADSLDLGKVYCCRFDCPERHCEDRPRGCYFIDKYRCLRWIAYGNARKVESCDECPFPRNDFGR